MTGTSLTEQIKAAGALTLDAKAAATMQQALDQFDGDIPDPGGSGVKYLNFSGKHGVYKLGKDKDDVDPEEIFVIDPSTCFVGYQCWKAASPVDKIMWSVFEPQNAVAATDLPDHSPYNERLGEGWRDLRGFLCASIDTEDLKVQFSTDSKTGKMGLKVIFKEIVSRLREGEPCWPVIHFDREEFTAQGQKNWKPVFLVETWTTKELATAFFGGITTREKFLAGAPLTKAQEKKYAAMVTGG